jgi:two-component system, LuxR family, sensor kinase FixL
VLHGEVPRATLEYPCNSPTKERWFELDVEPLRRPEGGALVSHIDVTARRHAEDEARRQRDELAHALRVTTLGELMASVSHEVNQPLAAIMTGAQAARRLLARPDIERGEVQEALDDVIEDSRRAAQIIRRLRALFRKDHAERKTIHVTDLITEVTSLVRADLLRRSVALHVEVDDGLPPLRGDTIQLQQVLLNLAVNAMEAMATVETPRELEVIAARSRPGVVEIQVADTGIGIDPSRVDTMFEPFVTTKAAGLGLGLSISRSIVEAHEGRIWATVNATRGLTVHIELPGEESGAEH